MAGTPLILIGGGPRSGKSGFALALARRCGPRRLFLATAQPGDADMHERIRRHRAERGDDFDTIEEPLELAAVLRQHAEREVVVIDCLTLWLTNLLLHSNDPEAVLARVDELIAVLAGRSWTAIVVTNEVGLGIVPDSELGRLFRDLAGAAHQRLSRAADEVYVSVLGTMLRLKPSPVCVEMEQPRMKHGS